MASEQDILNYIIEHKDQFDTKIPDWNKIYENLPNEFGWQTGEVTDFLHGLGIYPEYYIKGYLPYCFLGSSIIHKFNIPKDLVGIDNSAFIDCAELREIDIPNKIKEIGPQAFNGCSSLRKVTMTDSVTFIGDYCFSHCYKLTEINLSKNLGSIMEYTFNDCPELTTIRLPKSIKEINNYAFRGCTKLENIFYEGTMEDFKYLPVGEGAFEEVPAPGIICSDGVYPLE
jgi:hypothetical protein